MPTKIDGSKYFYWKGQYLRTGSLRAFDYMTKHYLAAEFYKLQNPPAGKRRKTTLGQVSSDEIWIMPAQGITLMEMAKHAHIHDHMGRCAKNRFGPRCNKEHLVWVRP
jgi:hypothetical protein